MKHRIEFRVYDKDTDETTLQVDMSAEFLKDVFKDFDLSRFVTNFGKVGEHIEQLAKDLPVENTVTFVGIPVSEKTRRKFPVSGKTRRKYTKRDKKYWD